MCLTCPNIPNIPSHPTDPVTEHHIVKAPPSPTHAFALFLADVIESTKPICLRHIVLGQWTGVTPHEVEKGHLLTTRLKFSPGSEQSHPPTYSRASGASHLFSVFVSLKYQSSESFFVPIQFTILRFAAQHLHHKRCQRWFN
jgi:hypothetical protein